jgi:hypothetical protein
MVAFQQDIDIRYIDGKHWLLTQPFWYVYEAEDVERFEGVIPAGFIFDFHSIPRVFWSVISPTEYGHAAAIHDHTYKFNLLPRVHCDKAYGEALVIEEAPEWKRCVMYRAVRTCGWRPYGKYGRMLKAKADEREEA